MPAKKPEMFTHPSRLVYHYFALEEELRRTKERLAELENRAGQEKVIVLRDVPRAEIKEEIRRITFEDGTVLYSDIVQQTRMCPAVVMELYDEVAAEKE